MPGAGWGGGGGGWRTCRWGVGEVGGRCGWWAKKTEPFPSQTRGVDLARSHVPAPSRAQLALRRSTERKKTYKYLVDVVWDGGVVCGGDGGFWGGGGGVCVMGGKGY